jgi:plasmid maintenance system antidote protein VapI
MATKNPPHPGGLIGDTLDELKVSIVAAAKGLGVIRTARTFIQTANTFIQTAKTWD